jgi:protein dpy-30
MIQNDKESSTSFHKANLQGLPLRSYLDHTVIPVLVEGLKIVAKER